MIFDAVSRHRAGVMSLESFREKLGDGADSEERSAAASDGEQRAGEGKVSFSDTLPSLREAEQALIDEALRRAQGNQSVAARTLGLSRRALNNRLRRSDHGSPAR
jgi:DNA-binding NtrC family response regulator